MHLDRVTVTDLIHEPEACDPDAEVRIVQQPAWPFETAVDPTNAVVQVDLGGTPVAHLGEAPSSATSPTLPASNSAGSQAHQQQRQRARRALRPGTKDMHPIWRRLCRRIPRSLDIHVQLSGEDGERVAVLGRTTSALRADGVPHEEIDAYFADATSADYDHLLQTTMHWVD
jgi:hypothetical protein